MTDIPEPVTRAPEPPTEAEAVFGDQLGLARRYADLLATTGISHGLVGPREAPRLWERHLVNCAVMHELVPQDGELVDIGSGAGLPGIVLAIVRPDLHVHLVEPLLRRTVWLEETIGQLGLPNVTVHRGRAEEVSLPHPVPVATARAVASLDKLVRWSFPLLVPGGRLLALKGEAAEDELAAVQPYLARLDVPGSRLHVVGEDRISEPVRVVEIERPDQLPADLARTGRGAGGAHGAGGTNRKKKRRTAPRRTPRCD